MYQRLINEQIGLSVLIRHTIIDSEFVDEFIVDDSVGGTIDGRFNIFLEGFYSVYERRNKNPVINTLVLMSKYGSFKHKSFKSFLESKNIVLADYEKYMVLL